MSKCTGRSVMCWWVVVIQTILNLDTKSVTSHISPWEK